MKFNEAELHESVSEIKEQYEHIASSLRMITHRV